SRRSRRTPGSRRAGGFRRRGGGRAGRRRWARRRGLGDRGRDGGGSLQGDVGILVERGVAGAVELDAVGLDVGDGARHALLATLADGDLDAGVGGVRLGIDLERRRRDRVALQLADHGVGGELLAELDLRRERARGRGVDEEAVEVRGLGSEQVLLVGERSLAIVDLVLRGVLAALVAGAVRGVALLGRGVDEVLELLLVAGEA